MKYHKFTFTKDGNVVISVLCPEEYKSKFEHLLNSLCRYAAHFNYHVQFYSEPA